MHVYLFFNIYFTLLTWRHIVFMFIFKFIVVDLGNLETHITRVMVIEVFFPTIAYIDI